MADQQSGPGYYSGKNKIPTVNEFLAKLDKDKRDRDQKIDEQRKAQQSNQSAGAATNEATPHVNQEHGIKGTQRKVFDPTTERDVTIEDVNKETVETAKNPIVSNPSSPSFMLMANC